MRVPTICLVVFLGLYLPLGAATIVVDIEGGGDYIDIQAAINTAAVGDTVLVKPGEYLIVRPIEFLGRAITLRAEDGPEVTTIRMSDSPIEPERASVIILERGEGAETLLDGFTLTGGRGTRMRLGENASMGGRHWAGGALLIRGASPTVKDCTLVENEAEFGAGACILDEGSPSLVDCRILRNTSESPWSGAVWCSTGATPKLDGCTIAENIGNGVYMEVSTVSLMNCRILRNSNHGVESYANVDAFLNDCTIAGNLKSGLSGGSVLLEQCTIAGNGSAGVESDEGWGHVTVRRSIVWGNGASSFELLRGDSPPSRLPVVFDSCIEGDPSILGSGNIHDDPLFCGWGGEGDVHVDASAAGPGDGSDASPYPDLASALDGFSYALAPDSPCIGAGEEGNLGADHGVWGRVARTARTIRLAPGSYAIFGWNLAHDVSLEGAGREETSIEGTVLGLQTGSRLSRLRVTGGEEGGVIVPRHQAPEISDCTIRWNRGEGLQCLEGSSPELNDCEISENEREGVRCHLASPTLTGCTVMGNRDVGLGCSGIGSSPVLRDCAILRNGNVGVTCGKFSTALLENCTIAENEGGGLTCAGLTSPTLDHCTIAMNSGTGGEDRPGAGIDLKNQALAVLESCIVWGNEGGGIVREEGTFETVSRSCVEGDEAWEGDGNLAADPLFCAWGPRAEVWVDASNSVAGDGSEASPYRQLASALEFSYGLADGSPCIGSGEGGSNMGADHGFCDVPGLAERTVRLAAGRYDIAGHTLALHASLEGAGEEETVVEGTILGLRTDSRLSNLTVTQGRYGGIVIAVGQSPQISRCTISRAVGRGVTCSEGAAPRLEDCTIEESAGDGLFAWRASPTLLRCRIHRNRGRAAFFIESSPVLEDCEISENFSQDRSLLFIRSSVTLSSCEVRGNRARFLGIELRESSGQIVACEILGNWTAMEDGGEGGSVSINGESDPPEELALVNCTIAGNLVVTNSPDAPIAAGVWVARSLMASITNCTIAQNALPTGPGGGIYCYYNTHMSPPRGYPTVKNSIVWGNTPNTSCGARSHCLTSSRDDPLFVSPGVFDFTRFKIVTIAGEEVTLPDFIVEEPDFQLREGSPAIDAGTPDGAPETDIAGNSRSAGDAPDIGAYEFVPRGIRFIRGDCNGDGDTTNAADALHMLRVNFMGNETAPCKAACDANGDGKTSGVADALHLLTHNFIGGVVIPAPFPECGPGTLVSDDEHGCDTPPEGCP